MFKIGDRVICNDTDLTNTEDSFGVTGSMNEIIENNKYLVIAAIKSTSDIIRFKRHSRWNFHIDDFSLANKLLINIKNNKQAEMQEV